MESDCRDCPFRRNEDGIECCAYDTYDIIVLYNITECPMEKSQ